MSTPDIDIMLLSQKGAWIQVLVVLLAAASASQMLLLEINPVWWVPPHVLVAAVILFSLFATPIAIAVRPCVRTMVLRYQLGYRSKSYSFDELDSIWSYVRVSSGADTDVVLEVRLKNGERVVLVSARAAWDKFAAPIGFSGAREPQDLTDLRRQISSATGMRDLGFCN